MSSQLNTDSWLSEINVTPFVDVLLVLLVIFMVTAPVMTRSVGVNLPKEKVNKASSKESIDLTKTLVIGLTKKGDVIFEKKQFDIEQFFIRFGDLMKNRNIIKVYIQADKTVTYQNLLQLMVFLKNSGHENIGLVFEET